MKHVMGEDSKSRLTNVQEGDIQPNAVDLRLGKVFRISSNVFVVDEEKKIHRGTEEVLVDQDGYFVLAPGQYEVIMENIIHVGEGEAGWVITRSTFNRNGAFLTSGLYDSGYHGVMAGVLNVGSGILKVKPGTRIGQYLSFKAETLGLYNGSYGINSQHDKKYGA